MGDYTIILKEIDYLKNFKNTIKKWKPELCPCRLCKIYIQNLEYLPLGLYRKNSTHFF